MAVSAFYGHQIYRSLVRPIARNLRWIVRRERWCSAGVMPAAGSLDRGAGRGL